MFVSTQILFIKKQFTLKKEERLKSRKQIQELFTAGKSFVITPFRVFYAFSPKQGGFLQAGFSASSRTFKKAVHRNRIKRLTREAYRLQKNEVEMMLRMKETGLVIFFIYTAKELPDYNLVTMKMQLIVQRLLKSIP